MKGEIPKWFSDRVKQGLGAITVLSLPGTPFDDMRKTSEVWMMALWTAQHWNAELDAARLDAAFLSVARRAERWPAPKHVLDALPVRPTPPTLAPPSLTPEQLATNRRRVRALAEMLSSKRTGLHNAHVLAFYRACL